jgi:hypothetical protein
MSSSAALLAWLRKFKMLLAQCNLCGIMGTVGEGGLFFERLRIGGVSDEPV